VRDIVATLSIIYNLSPDYIYARWSINKALDYYEIGTRLRQDLSALDSAKMLTMMFGTGADRGLPMEINEYTPPEQISDYYANRDYDHDSFSDLWG
jgi:hypothetical protein